MAEQRKIPPSRVIGAEAEERHGLIFHVLGDVCGFSPPLIITEAEIDELFDRFGRALDAITAIVEQKHLAAG